IRLWDMATGRKIGDLLTGHTGPIDSVAFSADGKTLAAGGQNGTVRLWDVANQEPITTLTGHTAPVYSVAFSPGGKTLASGGADGTIRLWNVTNQEPITTLTGHTRPADSVAFSPGGTTLARGSDTGLRLCDAPSDPAPTRPPPLP